MGNFHNRRGTSSHRTLQAIFQTNEKNKRILRLSPADFRSLYGFQLSHQIFNGVYVMISSIVLLLSLLASALTSPSVSTTAGIVHQDTSTYLMGVKQISAGHLFACALLDDDSILCWGDNYYGQLGNGDIGGKRIIPVSVQGLTGRPVMISVGGYRFYEGGHACALLKSGRIQCWGANGDGQLGNKDVGGRSPKAVRVKRLAGPATAVTTGGVHTCALLKDGRVQCWGDNSAFQLATLIGRRSFTPVTIPLPQKARAIAAGGAHTCAILEDGSVTCWGDNRSGQLGDGTKAKTYQPVSVQNLGGRAVAITAGHAHTCALLADGRVRCWGNNYYGQLGDGTTDARYRPVTVKHLRGHIIQIQAGGWHTCALTDNGQAFCWGRGIGLGVGHTESHTTPVLVAAPYGVYFRSLAAGYGLSCGVSDQLQAFCWGTNWYGQTGKGVPVDNDIPFPLLQLPAPARHVATSRLHTCAVLQDGSTWCWGNNGRGQLGTGDEELRLYPTHIHLAPARKIAVNAEHSCALLKSGAVQCWGAEYGNTPVSIPGLSGPARDLDMTESFEGTTCAVLEDGSIQCWERFSYMSPVSVSLPITATSVTVGESYKCALGTQGDVYCWGSESHHKVPLPGPARSVAAGRAHACVALQNGHVYCWGENNAGQIGIGSTGGTVTTPTQVIGLTQRAVRVTAGENFSCAILEGEAAYCWGAWGEDVPMGTVYTTPHKIPGLQQYVEAVAPNANHICAWTTAAHNGRVYCWSERVEGQGNLGIWGRNFQVLYPAPVVSRPILSLHLNVYRGRPGSAFTLYGYGARTNDGDLQVTINGRSYSVPLPVSPEGFFIGFLRTSENAQEGTYFITVSDGSQEATVALRLDYTFPLVSQEGGGTTLVLKNAPKPAYYQFLPWNTYWGW